MARLNKHRSTTHDFYCIQCGNRGIPIVRQRGHEHSKGHLKKLYCIYCKEEINHFECRTTEDVETFKTKFSKGEYLDYCLSDDRRPR